MLDVSRRDVACVAVSSRGAVLSAACRLRSASPDALGETVNHPTRAAKNANWANAPPPPTVGGALWVPQLYSHTTAASTYVSGHSRIANHAKLIS